MLIVLVILYMAPTDLCPGPVDDIIVLLVGLAAQKGINKLSEDD